tara:strand:+ start:480 stop:1223 length:744 start_codon:yes stop_codon:yes gene_type:complete
MTTFKSVMILAGGKGTRFKEYTDEIPKPMIMANGKPLLIHILNIYKKYGIENCIILAGYKKNVIQDYFEDNFAKHSDSSTTFVDSDNLKVTVLDTGEETMTGGRLKQGIEYLGDEQFYLTYGDGIADVNITELTKFHIVNEAKVTLTAVRPPARFGSLELDKNLVMKFGEKDNTNEGWINGGFFVINKDIISYLDSNDTIFEREPLESIARDNNLYAYKHDSFWQCVDTIRELEILEAALKNKKINI